MSETIKVKNEHSAPVEVELDNKSNTITIDSGKEKDLSEEYLTSKSLESLLAKGNVRLVEHPATTDAQFKLARRILAPLTTRLAVQYQNLSEQMRAKRTALAKSRDDFNRDWDATEKVLVDAKAAGTSAAKLNSAGKFFLSEKLENSDITKLQADITKLETEIATLEGEDLATSGKTLKQWYADRQTKQTDLEKARKALEEEKAKVKQPFKDLLKSLEKAATDLATADPTKIGAKIAPW